ncbi:MAG: hypothetical protein WCY09_08225 [Candidatus Omnitrophota bacterium]
MEKPKKAYLLVVDFTGDVFGTLPELKDCVYAIKNDPYVGTGWIVAYDTARSIYYNSCNGLEVNLNTNQMRIGPQPSIFPTMEDALKALHIFRGQEYDAHLSSQIEQLQLVQAAFREENYSATTAAPRVVHEDEE